MRYELSLDVFWQFELGREDIDVIEAWYLVSVIKTEAVSSIRLCIWIVAVDCVVSGAERVFWNK